MRHALPEKVPGSLFSLQARVVFPVDRPPIEHGVVTIDGGRIVAVGTKAASGPLTDLGQVALLPGLVNAHTHLEFSHLLRPLGTPGMSLADWIRLLIAERGRRRITLADAIAAGLRESTVHGVTMIGEIATGDAIAYRRMDNPVRRADGQACPSYGTSDLTLFVEVIGYSRGRAVSALAAASERLDDLRHSFADAQLGISPHAPYTVSLELLGQLIGLARQRDLPVAMHLAESADELELLQAGSGPLQQLLDERSMWDAGVIPRGSRPLDYLRHLTEAPRALVIHGNYLNGAERAFLAAHADRMSIVYCPRTHAYFDYPHYPLAELLAAGVRVALGTDSRASNPDLDLIAEMRHVARTHPEVDRHDILRMGTLAGAEALGRADALGSLSPGKPANLVAIPLPATAPDRPEELLESLLADSEQTVAIWLRGQQMRLTN